jgi:hypothetical protein
MEDVESVLGRVRDDITQTDDETVAGEMTEAQLVTVGDSAKDPHAGDL